MVEQSNNLQAFVKLGRFFKAFCDAENDQGNTTFIRFGQIISAAKKHNGWFTGEHIIFALRQWANCLTEKNLSAWLEPYNLMNPQPKTIAIIMAGNIPLVGFHDFICVLLSGHKALCKLSSNDALLLPFITDLLIEYEPRLKERIEFVQTKLEHYDAVIATGSNNTSRYFEYYFGKKPNIIRKNRTSVAVMTAKETKGQLEALGLDIFEYYGLGCRNVSKLFVPKDYDFDSFFKAMFLYKKSIEHHKYANNYDYNKAVYLMSDFNILDNGFMLLKEDRALHSPISVLYFEHYDKLEEVQEKLVGQQEHIQCIVAQAGIENEIPFGSTQSPQLGDYADGVDTMKFLTGI